MSDQQDDQIKQQPQETADAEGAQQGADAAVTADNAGAIEPVPAVAAAPGKRAAVVAWIALLLVLVLAAGLAWLWRELQAMRELQARETLVLDHLQQQEQAIVNSDSELDTLGDSLRAQLRSGLSALEDELAEVRSGVREQQRASSQLNQSIQALTAQVTEQGAQLSQFNAVDRQDWLLAEAQYLLRLANQRLIMAADTRSAQSLLASADSILRELDDVRLHPARAAVAADLAAVKAVPRVDVEGIYLRLAALTGRADKLVIFQLSEREIPPRPAPATDWQGRLQQGYQAALEKLSSYIIVRRRDVPMQALMDPQWEGLVRQNLRMLLEQAQVALLSGNQLLYRESLQRALHWVGAFFDSDEIAARALAADVTQLADLTVAVEVPDISGSLQALKAVSEQELSQELLQEPPQGGAE